MHDAQRNRSWTYPAGKIAAALALGSGRSDALQAGACHYGGLDTFGLTRTGRWKDADSADRYNHTMASPEAKRADLLP